MHKQTRIFGIVALAALAVAALAQQAPRRAAFQAVHYDVTAHLTPASRLLTARARVDFLAEAGTGLLEFELHSALRITAVRTADGKELPFERDAESPLRARVTLPAALQPGEKTTLVVDYTGTLLGETGSSASGPPLASIREEGAFLLQPARWFPLTAYPAGRYTASFELVVPETMAVVGTGKSQPPTVYAEAAPAGATLQAAPSAAAPSRTRGKSTPARTASAQDQKQPIPSLSVPPPPGGGARILYVFRSEQPEAAGSFVAATLQLKPVRAEGMTIAVYTSPATAATADPYGEAAARILNLFSEQFGALPEPKLTIVQLPAGGPAAFAAPGLALISERQWQAPPNERLLARLVAAQWWQYGVSPATADDAWLADGLARYSEIILLAQGGEAQGPTGKALEEFAIGALTYEDAAPIAQASRLELYGKEYRSIVANKGALVFHMLRARLGEAAFRELLRNYHAGFTGKTARIDDFRKLALAAAQKVAASAPPAAGEPAASPPDANLTPFFIQWVSSTGIPEFKLEYTVFRTQKGFKTIGKVKQDLDTFRMPVAVRIETLGNPEFKTIDVVGTETSFVMETFGRPKPAGIVLDPENHVLKSSPQLRVRAAIGRGEELAEEGMFFEATQQYQAALEVQKNNSLAHFRLGEAAFYQKNYQSAANAFRDALVGDLSLSYKWVEVWSHIYLGKIFDLSGQRERAIREYGRAKEISDDTGGAQAEADKYLSQPYQETPAKP